MQPASPVSTVATERTLDDPRQMALEELKELQAIIGRYDEHAFKIRNWATAIAGAIVVASVTLHIHLLLTILFGIVAIPAVFFVELLHRGPQRHAIERVRVIEAYLRDQNHKTYDGPLICESLGEKWTLWDMLKEAKIHFNWLSYVILFALVLAMVVGSVYRGSVASGFKLRMEKSEKDTKTEVNFDLDASPQDQQKLFEKARNNLGVP
ncbi:MAG: hypothetical protein L0Y72_26650 [Gemmataceae bacterium]|nr:hypothetical protein [Gemmataceae bacterium]MCI0742629.1 hypothetical protein [Gemmataceae bacterium]